MVKATRISFGGTAAIVTSMALLVGLYAANAGKASVIGALLIIAVADNLIDSLSIQMYEESERLDKREAFLRTLSNFATRLLVGLTFVVIVVLFWKHAVAVGVTWGMTLLSAMSYIFARGRNTSAITETLKYVGVAMLVISVSEGIGYWITAYVI